MGNRTDQENVYVNIRVSPQYFAFNNFFAFVRYAPSAIWDSHRQLRLCVIGLDDVDMASVITPGLTTIRQPMRDIGAAAFQILLRESDAQEQRVFGVRLIKRPSLAPPSSLTRRVPANAEVRHQFCRLINCNRAVDIYEV